MTLGVEIIIAAYPGNGNYTIGRYFENKGVYTGLSNYRNL